MYCSLFLHLKYIYTFLAVVDNIYDYIIIIVSYYNVHWCMSCGIFILPLTYDSYMIMNKQMFNINLFAFMFRSFFLLPFALSLVYLLLSVVLGILIICISIHLNDQIHSSVCVMCTCCYHILCVSVRTYMPSYLRMQCKEQEGTNETEAEGDWCTQNNEYKNQKRKNDATMPDTHICVPLSMEMELCTRVTGFISLLLLN